MNRLLTSIVALCLFCFGNAQNVSITVEAKVAQYRDCQFVNGNFVNKTSTEQWRKCMNDSRVITLDDMSAYDM